MAIQGVIAEQMLLSPIAVRECDRYVVVTGHNGKIRDFFLVLNSARGEGIVRVCHKDVRGTPMCDLQRLVTDLAGTDWSTIPFDQMSVVTDTRSGDPSNITVGKPACFKDSVDNRLVTGVPVTNIFSLT